jgi:protein O-mannosyl-transferase
METLLSELYFYIYAHVPERREEAESKLDALIATTTEPLSKGWNLAPNVEKAKREGHPNIEKLEMYARKISG